MSFEGVRLAAELLEEGGSAGDAVEIVARYAEDLPEEHSVGYGGLPNERGFVELDAGFMDGGTLAVGALAALSDFRNPITIARSLSGRRRSFFLVGRGGEEYAAEKGFERANMLTPEARAKWEEELRRVREGGVDVHGHDTIGVVCLDKTGSICAGTSTSGLFMKKPGRVGDSPLPGSGYYADNEVGGAVATGVGEDIMKGCLSYEVVRLMRSGMAPAQAAVEAVSEFSARLMRKSGEVGPMSVVCMDINANFGAATNRPDFPFAFAAEGRLPALGFSEVRDGVVLTRWG